MCMRTILTRTLILATTLSTLIVNLFLAFVPVNFWTTAQVADFYPVMFMPAGFVFGVIWTVIYIGWIAFTLYIYLIKDRDNKLIAQITPWYVISGVANCLWLIFWAYMQPVICLLIMIVLLISLIAIYIQINRSRHRLDNNLRARNWMVRIPFSIYLAWICVATIANVSVALYSLGVDKLRLEAPAWSAALILMAGVLAILFLLFNRDWSFSLVIIFSVIGILIKFPNQPLIFFSVIAVVATLVYGISITSYMQMHVSET